MKYKIKIHSLLEHLSNGLLSVKTIFNINNKLPNFNIQYKSVTLKENVSRIKCAKNNIIQSYKSVKKYELFEQKLNLLIILYLES